MFPHFRITVPLGVYLVSVGVASAQAPPTRVEQGAQRLLKQGEAKQRSGDVKGALRQFDEAARTSPSNALRAESALKAGQARYQLSRKAQDKRELLEQAASNYRQAVKTGTPRQQASARNNLGAIYLALDRPADAIKVIEACRLESIEKSRQFVVHFNLATACERSGQNQRAVAEYRKSLSKNPEFMRAAQQGRELVLRTADARLIPDAYGLAETLLRHGHVTQAKELAIGILQKREAFGPKAELLLAVLVRCYTQSDMTPERFFKEPPPPGWLPPGPGKAQPAPPSTPQMDLRTLAHAGLSTAAAEIEKAFLGRLKVEINREAKHEVEQFPWWSSPARDARMRRAFSALLGSVGDYYAGIGAHSGKPKNAKMALARYLLAWDIDAGNSQAAQNAAWVLSAFRREVDPDGQVTASLIDAIFVRKGRLYRYDYKRKEDWENILRMHFLLGTIFESQKRWGSEREPRSAIFQWTWAINAEREVLALDGGRGSGAPGLHEHLAIAYTRARPKQHSKAFDQYLETAAAYLKRIGDPPWSRVPDKAELAKARESLRAADALSFDRTPAQKARIEELRRKLR